MLTQRYTEECECGFGMTTMVAQARPNRAIARASEQPNRRVAQRCHHVQPGTLPHPTADLAKRHIFDIVSLIFNTPVTTFQGHEGAAPPELREGS